MSPGQTCRSRASSIEVGLVWSSLIAAIALIACTLLVLRAVGWWDSTSSPYFDGNWVRFHEHTPRDADFARLGLVVRPPKVDLSSSGLTSKQICELLDQWTSAYEVRAGSTLFDDECSRVLPLGVRVLDLSNTRATGRHLARCADLTSVSLSGCTVDVCELVRIVSMPSLRSLNLDRARLTNGPCEHMSATASRLEAVSIAHLGGDSITSASELLRCLSYVDELNISGTVSTLSDAAELLDDKVAIGLLIAREVQWSDREVEALAKSIPKLRELRVSSKSSTTLSEPGRRSIGSVVIHVE